MKYHPSNYGSVTLLKLTIICAVWGRVRSQQYLEKNCKEIIGCTDPMNMLSSDRRELSAVSSKEDIDRVCPGMKSHLDCIDRHTKRCMSPDEQNTFSVLYNGTIVVITKLCHNETYQQEFLKYAPCMQRLKKEDNCDTEYKEELESIQKASSSPGEADERNTVRRVCCSFQKFLSCSDRSVREVCGSEAGAFNKNMLDTMADTLLKEECQKYPLNSSECHAVSMASQLPSGASRALPPLLTLLALAHVALRAVPSPAPR